MDDWVLSGFCPGDLGAEQGGRLGEPPSGPGHERRRDAEQCQAARLGHRRRRHDHVIEPPRLVARYRSAPLLVIQGCRKINRDMADEWGNEIEMLYTESIMPL